METFVSFLVGIMLGAALTLILMTAVGNTHMDGQLDALNGDIYYELHQRTDGTVVWIYVPGGVGGNCVPR